MVRVVHVACPLSPVAMSVFPLRCYGSSHAGEVLSCVLLAAVAAELRVNELRVNSAHQCTVHTLFCLSLKQQIHPQWGWQIRLPASSAKVPPVFELLRCKDCLLLHVQGIGSHMCSGTARGRCLRGLCCPSLCPLQVSPRLLLTSLKD